MNAANPQIADDATGAPAIQIIEVSARDGLQSDPTMLDTATKVALITKAVQAGLRRIETVSFVNPKRVPQMADADAVMAALLADTETRNLGASYIGLVLNRRGLERAVQTSVDEINVVVVASDTFAERNQGAPSAALLDAAAEICSDARSAGLFASVTIAASFGCPYEGAVPLDRLEWVLSRVAECGVGEVALADSIGVANPVQMKRLMNRLRTEIGERAHLSLHLHDTRGLGLANVVAALECGIDTFDASLGGLGG